MGSTVKNRALAGGLVACFVLAAAMPGWGTELAGVRLLDLPDRDVVVLDGKGEALESTLKVYKPNPGRIELMFKSEGQLPSLPGNKGDLIDSLQLGSRENGFLLTVRLGGDVPVNSADSFYRETVLPGGRTVIEVFSADSNRSPFKTEWLAEGGPAPAEGGTPVRLDKPAPVPAPAPKFVPDAPKPVPAQPAPGGDFTGATFDENTLSLTLRGISQDDVRIVEQSFPPRVDIELATGGSGLTGLVHKNLRGQVTNVEVLDSRSGAGLVVRATLAANVGLAETREQGGNLVLTFARKSSAPAVPQQPSKTLPAAPKATPAPRPAAPAPVPQPLATDIDRELEDMSAAKPPTSDNGWTAAGPDGGFGEALSASAGGGGLDLSQATPPTGFGGQKQVAPSVDQILAMAQEDARRYVSGAATREDKYGQYALPEFEDADDHLSDVRVNLSASGGFSLYQFLMFLSNISGISIIVDPYWVDDPTGNPEGREPADPGFIPGEEGDAGFRGAGIFDPNFGATGSVRGNFDNVPFDQALDIVLRTHNLEKVVYRDKNDPYSKPVILITSKARIEYELQGTNEIDLYQLHYADPTQLVQILDQLNLLPLVNVGWYVYQGSNQGFGGGQGGGGNQGGGNQGGGGNFGGGGTRGFDASATAPIAAAVQGQYFDPLQIGSPLQALPPGGGGGGGGGGGTGGGGGGTGGGGGQGGFGGGQGGNQGNQLTYTAKSGLVIMRGTRETLDTVQSLIAKIDKPPKQVQLTVKIYTVSDEPENTFGLLNATATSGRFSFDYAFGDLSVGLLDKGTDLPDQYNAAFEFLQSQRKAKVVAEQGVTVIDGFQATFNDTRTRGQLSSTLTFDANGNAIRTAQFNPLTVGSSLNFTPQIDDRGRVTLSVNITISTFDGPEQIAPDGQATFQPTRQTNLTTALRLVDGQTALIAGVTGSTDSEVFQGVPYLSRLPIIGKLFGRTVIDKTNNQLFILINVHIVDDK